MYCTKCGNEIKNQGDRFCARCGSEIKQSIDLPEESLRSNSYYVYAHKNPDGEIFYVGKGTGKRAWSANRKGLWANYVELIGGTYDVVILKEGLTEDEALQLEKALIEKYGVSLINWDQNFQRRIYMDAFTRRRSLEKENKRILAQAKLLEKTDLEEAINLYSQALVTMYEYRGIVQEEGLFPEVFMKTDVGDIKILDRLTLCLKKAGRYEEMERVIEGYQERFPFSKRHATMKAVLKRAGAGKKAPTPQGEG